MELKTPLYDAHIKAGGQMVSFAGWSMPIHYGSQIKEHQAVREKTGMFDVSHMTVVDIQGPQTHDFLRHLLANDVAKLTESGQALYGCMLNDEGGIIDDLITYRIEVDFYRTVVNAATRQADLDWMRAQADGFDVAIVERDDLAMVAVQGPLARQCVIDVLEAPQLDDLKPFNAASLGDWFIARTGYTGEDGFEVLLPATAAERFWDQLLASGVVPCGLGARDSLRLEGGLNLYGQDMNLETHPFESNLGWTVVMNTAERSFAGAKALEQIKADGIDRQLVGLVLNKGAIPRTGSVVETPQGRGVITSGSFAPTLDRPIALARVPRGEFDRVAVQVRGRSLPAAVVKPPFVRAGKIKVDLDPV
jgi:aminomethyltransferase